VNNKENKSFLEWWKKDFEPGLLAARKAMAPHIANWQKVSVQLNKSLTAFVNEHRESIELWAQFAKIYPTLEPYIDNIANGLNDPEFEIANDVVELVHIFHSIDLQEDPSSVSLLSVISSENFQQSLINLYSNLTLDQTRLPLIKEALELHNRQFYAGSICLLYGLIEGVLTESFEKANYIVLNSNKVNPVKPDGTINQKANLSGLTLKLDHAITHQDQLQGYYKKIKSYELVSGNSDQTIPKTRNEILHGGSLTFNTEKRSAQLIVWLYSSILHIRVLGI
jgi:hypothetical protein